MKASVSEYEVKQLQVLSRAAILNKAQRGQLFHNLPAGLIKNEVDQVELDPDQRVQQAYYTIFAKFDEFGSIRQVYKWFHREGLEIPVRLYQNGVGLTWRVPTYSTLNNILTNPLYAGIYMYPRTKTKTRVVDGRVVKTHGHRTTSEDNPVLIKNLFQGYISGEKFERNQKIIANNTNMRGKMAQGAAREGTSLFAGLLRCGHCSRKLMVHYPAGKTVPHYFCPRNRKVAEAKSCLYFSGRVLETYVSQQILEVLALHAIEAAMLAEEKFNRTIRQKADAFSYAFEQAKYEAERIERQLNATEPENHLVYRTLTSRWQLALEKVEALESQYQKATAQQEPLSETERADLFALAGDLQTVWDHPETDSKTRTRLVRLLVKEIWVKAADPATLQATIHWQGGVHTEFHFKRSRAKRGQGNVKEQPVEIIKKLALVCEDQQIVRILNLNGIKTKENRTWCEFEVSACREQHKIAAFSQTEADKRSFVNLQSAAKILGLSLASVRELIKCGLIEARQVIKYAPWEIEKTEIEKPAVLRAAQALKKGQKILFHENQQELNL
jgi:ribosomal protein L7/L12